jgi:AcrR family transcriptional regulator
MTDATSRYHHGNLRAALLVAAEAELAEAGVAAFSLRRVAKRVGVSHSAPAHHFGDAAGLLDALATEGFRRFLAAMEKRRAEAPAGDPRARVIGSGLGYVDFAESAPALFRLMFGADRRTEKSPEQIVASEAAFRHLADGIADLRGASPFEDPAAMADVLSAWSMVHGYAELAGSALLKPLNGAPKAAREALLRDLLDRSLG